MKEDKGKRAKPYIVAILFGVSGALILWYFGAPMQWRGGPEKGTAFNTGKARPGDGGRDATRYASAIQSGRCEDVIAMTFWMQERLQYVRMASSSPDEESRERGELCRRTLERTPEGNQLSPEGIEDAYVFTPGARVTVIGADEGHEDLDKPVRERTWLEVQYPAKFSALNDQEGNPIKSLNVGVNISKDGYVLKAGVLGNLDIDFDSVSYRWTSEGA